MTDYISREATIKAAKCHYPKANEMIAGIILVPAADVRPVMHGKWMHGKETGREYLGDCLVGIFYDKWTCSECGYIVDDRTYSRINYSFCPHCGADMRPNLDTTKGDNHD